MQYDPPEHELLDRPLRFKGGPLDGEVKVCIAKDTVVLERMRGGEILTHQYEFHRLLGVAEYKGILSVDRRDDGLKRRTATS